jgi:hypothetical protein
MQRKRSFADWHAHDEVVRQEYLTLGGSAEIARENEQ